MKKCAVLMVALSLTAVACSDDGDSAKSAPAAPVTEGTSALATVTPLDAGVSIKKGSGEFVDITATTDVEPGDVVRTDGTGFAEVNYPDGSVTRLDVDTEFVVVSITDDAGVATTRAGLESGRVWSRVNDLGTEGEFSVDTSVGVATVRGTAFMVDCRNPDSSCDFTVLEGRVEVSPPELPMVGLDGPYTVNVNSVASSAPAPVPFDEAFSDPWVVENARLDAERGFETGDEMYEAYGALVGSFDGQFDGVSKIVGPDECVAPANCTTTVGTYVFSYVFSVECPAVFQCTRYVDMQFDNGGSPTQSRAEMRLDDGVYTWHLDVIDPSCSANGATQLSWTLEPLAAVRIDGKWVITEVQIESSLLPPAGSGCTSQTSDRDCANRDHDDDHHDNDGNGRCSGRDNNGDGNGDHNNG